MKYVFLVLSLLILFFNFTAMDLPALAQAAPSGQIQAAARNLSLGTDKHVNLEPMTLNANLRRPFLFFREQANQPWPVVRLFIFLIAAAGLAKFLTPHLVRETIEKIQQRIFHSIACALLYTTIISSMARFAFNTPGEALVPLGIFCIGLVQGSYLIGAAFGINLFASILHHKLNFKNNLTGLKTCLLYGLCLLLATCVIALLSTVPEIWRLPRIGNRMVMLVAMIGLGGLIARLRARQQ